MHSSHSYTINTIYLHICVALCIHSQHTTYFETVTLTLTLSCQRVHFKGLLKNNKDRMDWFWVGLSMIH